MKTDERLPIDELRPIDKQVLETLMEMGYTSPSVLRAKLNLTHAHMQEILYRLYIGRYILRPMRGIVVSIDWCEENPDHLKQLERTLNTVLPIKKRRGKKQ